MGRRRRREQGPQHHAEGQHGEKTHRRFIAQLAESSAPVDPVIRRAPIAGHHRMSEDREQHDEAEKSSELGKEHGDAH